MTASQRKLKDYQAGNLEAAKIISSDPQKFGGEESLMVRWARLVLGHVSETK
jgi:hypothetical protein